MEATTGVGPFVGQPAPETRALRRRAVPQPASRLADWPHTTRALPWMLFGFVAMLWVIPFDSVNLPVGGPVNMTLDRPLLVIFAAVWLLAAESPRRRLAKLSPIHWAFAGFIVIAIFSVLVHAEALVRVNGLDLAVKQLALLISYGVFFALAASILRPNEASKMVTAMLALACVTALGVIVEYRFNVNVFHDYIGPLFPGYVRPEGLGGVDSIGRRLMYGPTVQPLAVAVMLSMALPFAFAWLLKARDRRQQLIYAGMVMLLIGGAMATQKKTAMIGPLVCIILLACYRPKQMLRLAPLVVVLIGVVHVAAPGSLGAVVDQLLPGSVNKVNTTRDRVTDYEAITPDLAAHPLIGRGYGSYDQKVHRILDNEYLGLGIGVGLLGLIGYLSIFATTFFSANRVARSRDPKRAPPALGAAVSIVVALICSAILDFLSFPQLPYLLCFIAAIAYVLGRERLEKAR